MGNKLTRGEKRNKRKRKVANKRKRELARVQEENRRLQARTPIERFGKGQVGRPSEAQRDEAAYRAMTEAAPKSG